MAKKNRHKIYNKNHPIIRVDKDFKKMISKISKRKGLSHYEVIRRLMKTRYSKGYKLGYEKGLSEKTIDSKHTDEYMDGYKKGFSEGREQYAIKLPCNKCGKQIEFTPKEPVFIKMFKKLRASHGKCNGQ